MAARPCLVCGTPTKTGARCAAHPAASGYQAKTNDRGLGRPHQKLRATVIARWVATYGWLCPGHGVDPHPVPAGALTLDHVVSRSEGGSSDEANASVLCRACNSRKGGRNRHRPPFG